MNEFQVNRCVARSGVCMLIGIAGRAGDGKSTAAEFLQGHFADAKVYNFADDLKTLCAAAYPEAPREAWYGTQAEKEEPRVELGGLSGRDVQKRIGEAAKVIWGPNFWVDQVGARIEADRPEVAVVADVRFPQEARWVRRRGGEVWRLENPSRTSTADLSHPSEAAYWSLEHDEHLRPETLDELYGDLVRLAHRITHPIGNTTL